MHQLELEIQNVELIKTRSELEAANVALEAFNSTVSHELRQPLTLISCYAQILEDLCNDQLDRRFREYLQEIQKSTMQMGRRINCLLSFSSADHKKMRREKVDLSALAKTVAKELKLTTPGRHVRFQSIEGISVNADPELCSLVLENLIGNAWKFTGDQEKSVIDFGATQIDGILVCFVKDNGPGFTETDAEKLFKPFQRLAGEKGEGYGIGLATVQRIVQRHGGRVWAESALGKGATFFFTLE
nr:ATP-binding protein [uncultured Desulfuromonas sp.]